MKGTKRQIEILKELVQNIEYEQEKDKSLFTLKVICDFIGVEK